jgi:hypothetical protein
MLFKCCFSLTRQFKLNCLTQNTDNHSNSPFPCVGRPWRGLRGASAGTTWWAPEVSHHCHATATSLPNHSHTAATPHPHHNHTRALGKVLLRCTQPSCDASHLLELMPSLFSSSTLRRGCRRVSDGLGWVTEGI